MAKVVVKDTDLIDKFISLLDDANQYAVNNSALQLEGEIKRRTPVQTGRLRSSMEQNETSRTSAEVFTDVDYAQYVEFGTSRQKAQAMMRSAFDDNVNKLFDVFIQAYKRFFSQL